MGKEVNWIKTHCARMDHGGCALLVGVQNKQVVAVKGDPDGYLNRGYVCPKGLAAPERLNDPGRLHHPIKQIGGRGSGQWQRIGWDEALDDISDNLSAIKDRYGSRAVAFCQGMPKGMEHFALIRLANLFGSPNVVAVQDVCHAPREISGIHTCGFYPVVDWHNPNELIIVWGSNPTATNEEGQICSLLKTQIDRGAEIIVVDPRRTELAPKRNPGFRFDPARMRRWLWPW